MKHDYMLAAQNLDLFSINDHSAGLVWWHANGVKLLNGLKGLIKEAHDEFNYEEVKSPNIASCSLFEKSGHLEKFAHNMFIVSDDKSNYVIRPMSCPNHIEIYKKQVKSFNHLPFKLFEFGEVARNEPSGSLQSLFRMRAFCQDDSHVFAKDSDVESVLSDYIKMSEQLYKKLGFESIDYNISLRPEKRFGSDELWDKAEDSLRKACLANGISNWSEEPGGGAFYGPKLELHLKDKLGRSWQCGTIQLDYVLPLRFDLHYISKEHKKEVPVIVHHAVLGSLERFIGILLENYGEDLPFELKPDQMVIVPIKPECLDYCQLIHKQLKSRGFRSIVLMQDDNLNNKIKLAQSKYPRDIIVVGPKEMRENAVNLRKNSKQEVLHLDDYLKSISRL